MRIYTGQRMMITGSITTMSVTFTIRKREGLLVNVQVEVVRNFRGVRVVSFESGILGLPGPLLPVLVKLRNVSPKAREGQR